MVERVIAALLLGCTLAPTMSRGAGGQAAARAQEIRYHEAEILIYLLPVAEGLRSHGMDISWEKQSTARLNVADYFVFWVVNSKRMSNGSVTVGYFAVNRHTADVWDLDSRKLVTSAEIAGVQKILRQAHNIGEEVVEKYRNRPIELRVGSHLRKHERDSAEP